MSKFNTIKSFPNSPEHEVFKTLPVQLYRENSQRFLYGHEPVTTYLEGCYTLTKNDVAVGRFSLYDNAQLTYDNKSVATLGSFECINDQEIANELFRQAVNIAREIGKDFLIGPMEGSTWNNYRFSDSNQHPNFFLEPYHFSYYPEMFRSFGFSPIAQYSSQLDQQLDYNSSRIDEFEKIFKETGATIRNLDITNLEQEFKKIAQFSNEAFASNFLFTPVHENEFVTKYATLQNLFNPQLIWIVEDKYGEMQALSFSLQDFNNKQKKTLILKSLARKKDSPYKGIGTYLIDKTYQSAVNMGFEQVIHAFMFSDNVTVNISSNYSGRAYKSYTLFGLPL